MMVSFVLSFFPRDVLDEILNLIESVSEDFPSYSWYKTSKINNYFLFTRFFAFIFCYEKLYDHLSGNNESFMTTYLVIKTVQLLSLISYIIIVATLVLI